MKRFGLPVGALLLSALGAVACGNGDDTVSPVPVSDAGKEAAAPDATSPTEGGAQADAEAGAPAGDAGADAGPTVPDFALFVGTDYTTSELSVVALHPDGLAGHLALDDQDSVPYASSGHGFVLEHTVGQAIELDRAQPWTAGKTIDLNDGPDAAADSSNPRAVLVTTGTKAYAARYGSNVVQIVDVASATVTGTIDFSAFVAPDDADGLIEVQDAAYDAMANRAYFLLQRIYEYGTYISPDEVGPCLASHPEDIVGVDVSTDAVVDLNGAAAGSAIDLLGDNPVSMTPDFANGRILTADMGCYQAPDTDAGGADAGQPPRLGRGIESVVLATATPAWLYQTSGLDAVGGLVWIDGAHAYVNQGTDWFAWNPTQTTLGATAAGFPLAPFYDGTGRVIGLAAASPAAGSDAGVAWSVVAFDVTTSNVTTLAANPFQSVVPVVSSLAVSSALLH